MPTLATKAKSRARAGPATSDPGQDVLAAPAALDRDRVLGSHRLFSILSREVDLIPFSTKSTNSHRFELATATIPVDGLLELDECLSALPNVPNQTSLAIVHIVDVIGHREEGRPLGDFLDELHDSRSLNHVGLVPLTDVDIDVPADIEVIGLGLRVVMIALIHQGNDLAQELQSATREVAAIVIGIHRHIAILDRLKTLRNLIVIPTAGQITVADEVDLARLDVENQRRMMTHSQRGFDAVLFAHSLDSGSQFRLEFFRDISHDLLPLL